MTENALKYLDFVIIKTSDISSFSPLHVIYDELGFDNASDEDKNKMFELASLTKRLGITY